MTTDSAVELRVCKLLRVPPEKVYDAWIDPQVRRKWWGADHNMACTVCEIDATVGGAYRVGMSKPADGDKPVEEYIVVGTFTELDRPRRMVFTWQWEHNPDPEGKGGGPSVVTIDFVETQVGGKPATELVLTHAKLGSAHMRSDHGVGWIGCLRTLGYHFHDTWPKK